MTRAELAREIYTAHGGMTYAGAQRLLKTIMGIMVDRLATDGRLVISGFGTFKVVERRPRTGRDLGKGVPVRIPSRKTVVFIPSRKWNSRNSP